MGDTKYDLFVKWAGAIIDSMKKEESLGGGACAEEGDTIQAGSSHNRRRIEAIQAHTSRY